MKFYIVTPTFNSLNWLQRCIRSVADQVCDDVHVHHHVQDGVSSDGTQEWLQTWKKQHEDISGYSFTYESTFDNGMYDAINKAWKQIPSDADVTAHLNSDEQYLPGALSGIMQEFIQHPHAEIAVSTYIVVDDRGRYICHRRPVSPRKWISRTVCEIITCSCFHKVSAFMRHGIRFDSRWRAIADVVFFRNIVNSSPRFLIIPNLFTSVFTVTGGNLQWSSTSQTEWEELMSVESLITRKNHAIAYRWCNLKRFVVDMCCASPQGYSIFLQNSIERITLRITTPKSRWGNRSIGESDTEL